MQSLFGEDTVNDDELPLLAAEDFSYYLHHVPGCFFFLGGAEEGRTNAGAFDARGGLSGRFAMLCC